jgi:glyoxylase-like metal-dependent hydrolase (beta-lactamase superfamily II)
VTTEPEASLAERLYDSLHGRLLRLADHIQVYPGHFSDAAGDEELSGKPSTTIGFERRFNLALQLTAKMDFVRFVLADRVAA